MLLLGFKHGGGHLNAHTQLYVANYRRNKMEDLNLLHEIHEGHGVSSSFAWLNALALYQSKLTLFLEWNFYYLVRFNLWRMNEPILKIPALYAADPEGCREALCFGVALPVCPYHNLVNTISGEPFGGFS